MRLAFLLPTVVWCCFASSAPAASIAPAVATNTVGMKLILVSPRNAQTRSSFYIGATEVTQAQWKKVMGSNPSTISRGPKHSVEMITWWDAAAFCDRLSRIEHRHYRLPSKREWESAWRAGMPPRPMSISQVRKYAWCLQDPGAGAKPVGSKMASALGIYDMLGNVAEWGSDKIVRGGDILHPAESGPPEAEFRTFDRISANYIGFRVVLDPL